LSAASHRKTPCVGICSTTYGDLVCRGCKRFAHEIVGWNSFSSEQREEVWDRLRGIQRAVTKSFFAISDKKLLLTTAAENGITYSDKTNDWDLLYHLFLRLPEKDGYLEKSGIEVREKVQNLDSQIAVIKKMDAEFLDRSKAVYERNYKILAE